MDNTYKALQGSLISLSACAYAAGLPKLADELIYLTSLIPLPQTPDDQPVVVELVHGSSNDRTHVVSAAPPIRAISA